MLYKILFTKSNSILVMLGYISLFFACNPCYIFRVTRLHILIKHMWEVHKKCDDPILLEQAKQQTKLRKDDKVIKGVIYACNVIVFSSYL